MSEHVRFIRLNNNKEMPILGIGTSLRGKPKVDSDTFVSSVKHALNVGYRHIDTVSLSFNFFQVKK
jgi:diketogulonate reductase-like aldo/keto reductase